MQSHVSTGNSKDKIQTINVFSTVHHLSAHMLFITLSVGIAPFCTISVAPPFEAALPFHNMPEYFPGLKSSRAPKTLHVAEEADVLTLIKNKCFFL
jgi:hypothetical protein